MNAKLIRLGRAALCATTLMLGTATAHATVLVPGGTVVPAVLAGPAGTLVDSILTPLTSGPNLIANLRAAVVLNAGGTLDFYYQIGVSGTSGHNLALSTDQAFAIPATTFVTDVFYRLENGGLPFFHTGSAAAFPLTADRSGDGIVVGFNFTGPGALNSTKINAGEVSRILVVRTNATNYVPGLTTVANSVIAAGESFAPFAPFAPSTVPEPASLLLLGSAFAAAGYVARRRNAKSKPTTV
jgi:hypothetical protein